VLVKNFVEIEQMQFILF